MVIISHIALIALLNNNNETLLLKRPAHVHCPNVWSFPGGKIKENESPQSAAARELHEETNVTNTLFNIGNHDFTYPDKQLFFHFFSAFYPATQPLITESEHQWFALEQLHTLHMPQANQRLIAMIHAQYPTPYKKGR